MAKKRNYQPILIIVTILFLFLAGFLTYYFGFYKQTIYGIPSEVKVGDIIKFHAIAQVGGRAGITCYAHPSIEPYMTGVIFSRKELKDGCNSLPCNLYDQWSFSQSTAGTYNLDVAYTCSGVTAPPNDKLSFSVKPFIQLQCSDSEIVPLGKYNIDEAGNIRWLKVSGRFPDATVLYDNTNNDECLSETKLKEWYCGTDYIGYFKEINCPSGTKCNSGACITQTSTGGTSGGISGGETLDWNTGEKGSFCRDMR